jgi:hypothetical protein
MTMSEGQHPDLFQEAVQICARDALQFASALVGVRRILVQHQAARERLQAEQNEKAKRALKAHARAELAAARARWAPANDPQWLRGAGLLDVGAAWGAALPYADPASERFERSAQATVEKCESRLRNLHPYGMARYDRLRADGMGPVDAMQEAVPLFRRPAESYAQRAPVRPGLGPGAGLGHSWGAAVYHPTRADFETELQRQRGAQIVDRFQARAARDGLQPLDLDEQRVALESATNLRDDVIRGAVHAAPVVPTPRQRSWLQEFPFPIKEVVAAAASGKQTATRGRGTPSQVARTARPAQPPH